MATKLEELLGIGKAPTAGNLVESAQTTPVVTPTTELPVAEEEISRADQLVGAVEELPTPSPFQADVPSVIDATEAADAITSPSEITPELQTQMDERERVRQIALEREAAVGVGAEERLPTPVSEVEPPKAEGTAALLKDLFPEQEGIESKFLALRSEAGLDKLEQGLNTAQDSLDELNAQIEGIEQDVKAQIGQNAPASFIAATVADRTRRLIPELRRRQRMVDTASRKVTTATNRVNQRLGFVEKDIDAAIDERTRSRNEIFRLVQTFGSGAFEGVSDEDLNRLEKQAGLPSGTLKRGITALEAAPEKVTTFVDTSDGKRTLRNKETGELITELGDAAARTQITNLGGRATLIDLNTGEPIKDLGPAGKGSSTTLTTSGIKTTQSQLDNATLIANQTGEVPAGLENFIVDVDGEFEAVDVNTVNLPEILTGLEGGAPGETFVQNAFDVTDITGILEESVAQGQDVNEAAEELIAAGFDEAAVKNSIPNIDTTKTANEFLKSLFNIVTPGQTF